MATKNVRLGNMNIIKDKRFTFEQLCIRKEYGFSIDLNSMFIPSNPDSFDEVVFKLISKIDTSLLLLSTHGEDILSYTVIAIPLPNQDDSEEQNFKDRGRSKLNIQPPQNQTLDCSVIENAWEYLSTEGGWTCLQSLALLQPDSIPDNGARMYSLYQYVTCIMDVIRANYMFQKHKNAFHHETLEMFDDDAIMGAKQAIFGLLWKRSSSPLKRKSDNLALKRKANITVPTISSPKEISNSNSRNVLKLNLHDSQQVEPEYSTDSEEEEMDVDVDVDDEISFKGISVEKERDDKMYGEEASNVGLTKGRRRRQMVHEDSSPPLQDVTLGFEIRPTRTPKGDVTPALKGRRRTLKRDVTPPPSPPPQVDRNERLHRAMESEVEESSPERSTGRRKAQKVLEPPPALEDITLGFETSATVAAASKTGRKSMARKSMAASEWPEEERESILQIFDNFNPNVSEQKRIALTCKYVALQLDKDLPSKLLYQWVQKKGRAVKRTIASFDIPEGEQQKEVALKFYRELNDASSESARVAFSLKYLDAQYGFSLTSKQLYSWLNEKPSKKVGKKR